MPVVKQIAVPQIQTIEKIVEIPMVQAGCQRLHKGGGKVIFIASAVMIKCRFSLSTLEG